MLRDTDTRVLLAAIRERHAPLSWFTGDWPLGNHFYRPVSTLAFELDNRLYGDQAWGYGLTNVLLCIACTLLLFWYLRELTDRPILTGASVLIFGLWQCDSIGPIFTATRYLFYVALIGGILRHRLKIRMWAPAAILALGTSLQLVLFPNLAGRTIQWLPGRTATVMTLFALTAMAAYARYERISAVRKLPELTPLDPPATRSTTISEPKHGWSWVWGMVSVIATFLALGSYEQAVMLPAVLLATACTLRWQGYRVRWGWQTAFWAALVAYVVVRRQLVPPAPSSYQLQQFRSGPGVYLVLAQYSIPSLQEFATMRTWIESLPLALLTSSPYDTILAFATDIVTFVQAKRRWVFALAGWGMSLLAFLPMAWVKPFDHYHYWPMALRSLLVATLGWIALELTAIALSPQTRQAPPRPDPAPGSLPRP